MPIVNSPNEIIETERLLLRKFTVDDVDDMLKNWIADEAVQSSYGERTCADRQSAIEFFETWSTQYRWAIILKEINENIGQVRFCRVYEEENTAELEYCVGKQFWNKGYVTEAVKAFIEYAFKNTSITKIEAFHGTENPASGKVLRNAGMKPAESVLRFRDEPKVPDGNVCYARRKRE